MKTNVFPILLIFCLVFISNLSAADEFQEKSPVSLSQSDTILQKIKHYNQQSKKTLDISAVESLNYAKKALKMAEKIKANYWTGLSYYNYGNALFHSGKYEDAIQYINKAQNILMETDSITLYFKTTITLSSFYRNANKYYESLNYLFNMLDLCMTFNDTIQQASAFRSIALTYLSIEDYKNAFKYINKSVEVLNTKKDEKLLAKSLLVKAIILSKKEKYEEALYYFNRALYLNSFIENKEGMIATYRYIGEYYTNIGLLKKALDNYRKALQLSIEIEFNKLIGVILTLIGHNYELEGTLKQALKYNRKALEARIEYGNSAMQGSSYINIGSILMLNKQLDSAEHYLIKGLEIVKKVKNYKIIKTCYQKLYQLALERKNYKNALHYQKLISRARDSVMTDNKGRELSELEAKYNLNRKDYELQVEKLKFQRKTGQFIIIAIASAFLLLVFTFILYRYRINQKLNRQYKNLNIDLETKISKRNKELRDKENQFKNLVEQIPLGVYRTTHEGNIVFANNALIKLLGYSSLDELLSINLESENKEKRFLRSRFKTEIMKEGEVRGLESIWTKRDGTKIIVSESARVVENEKGNPVFFEGVVEDITKRKLTEKELKIALEKSKESDRLKSSFLSTIQHELRTPLNSIMGFSEIMALDDSLNEENKEYINLINESGCKLLNIINDILDISLIAGGRIKLNKEPFKTREMLEKIHQKMISVLKNKPEKTSLELNLNIDVLPQHEKITTDKKRIEQIITILTDNAIKFTYKGSIEINCTSDKKDQLKFSVKDTGVGIPDDKQSIIFEQFRQAEETDTRRFGGSGLGLTICKNLVELMNGEIWVESTLNKGSAFYFTIPVGKKLQKRKPVLPNEKNNEKEDFNFNKKEILVAEDNFSNYLLIKTHLKKTQAVLLHAKNGEEAINFIKNYHTIKIVLMDIQLPGISGYEATSEIKKIRPETKIIAVTAYASEEDKKEALNAGCDAHISKPIVKNKLLRTIKEFLNNT